LIEEYLLAGILHLMMQMQMQMLAITLNTYPFSGRCPKPELDGSVQNWFLCAAVSRQAL
jgi:hypothetical protein